MYVKSWTKSIIECIRMYISRMLLLTTFTATYFVPRPVCDSYLQEHFQMKKKPSVPLPLSFKMNTPSPIFLKLQKFLLNIFS